MTLRAEPMSMSVSRRMEDATRMNLRAQENMRKLSSDMRINSPVDDAVGASIANKTDGQSTSSASQTNAAPAESKIREMDIIDPSMMETYSPSDPSMMATPSPRVHGASSELAEQTRQRMFNLLNVLA